MQWLQYQDSDMYACEVEACSWLLLGFAAFGVHWLAQLLKFDPQDGLRHHIGVLDAVLLNMLRRIMVV